MRKRILPVLLTLCILATLLPSVALAVEPTAPSVFSGSGNNICANGTPIKIVAGTTADYTNILYDKDNDGAIGDTEYLKIGSADPTDEGYDLSGYRILGGKRSGAFGGDSKITISGGYVGDVHGGNFSDNLTGDVTIVMNGGSVERILACGYWGSVGGSGKTASITITGGTVRGGADNSVNLFNRIASETEKKLTITGGTINGTIAGATPTNGTNPVYKTALTLKGYDGSPVNNAAVTALTTDASYTYGMTDVKTDASGKLVVYLPEGTKVTAATVGSKRYTGSVTTTTDGTAAGDLTKATPDAPNCTFSFDGANAGKLMDATAAMEYSLDGGTSYSDCTADMALAADDITAANDIKVRVKAPAGDVQTIDITKAATPTGVGKTDCTNADNNNGTLTNVTAAMEYKKSDAGAWTACTGNAVTGLTNGTYAVRMKAAGTALASDHVTLTIAEFVTITYDANGGAGTVDNGGATAGTSFPLPVCPFTAPTGKQFKAWAIGSTDGTRVAAGGSYTFVADTTVCAIWEDIPPTEYTIHFHVNGGSGSVADQTSTGQKLSSLPAASRSGGYAFAGWYTAASGGTKITTDSVLTGETTLYAQWFYTGGSGGSTPSAACTVPVANGAGSLAASATVSNGTASIRVNDRQLDTLLTGAETAGSVSIDAGLEQNIDTATLSTAVIDKLADAANDSGKAVTGLDVTLDSGAVSLDAKALAAVSGQAKGSTVSIHVAEIDKADLTAAQRKTLAADHADDLLVAVTITSGGVVLSRYDGGKITVTLPYTLKAGEAASDVCVWHLADDGSLTLLPCSYDEASKTVRFVTDHLSDFLVGCDASAAWVNPFRDVAEADWFYHDVAYAAIAGLMRGDGSAAFDPRGAATRGMIVTILYRLKKEPAVTGACPFDDVAEGRYYEPAVTWAAANGIVYGYGNDRFGPQKPVTREQLATILYRYEQMKGGGFTDAWMFRLDFPDAAKVSDWAHEAVCWCTMNGILKGNRDGTLAPQGKAARCQVAAILHRFCENMATQ